MNNLLLFKEKIFFPALIKIEIKHDNFGRPCFVKPFFFKKIQANTFTTKLEFCQKFQNYKITKKILNVGVILTSKKYLKTM